MSLPQAPILHELYGSAVSRQFFEQLHERLDMPERGIYTLTVVVWLMIWQRLNPQASLSAAVQQVVQGSLGNITPADKRITEKRVSDNTGALCRARKRLPLLAVEAICDEVFTQLIRTIVDSGALRSRLFLLDGSSLRLEHTAALTKVYPLSSNPNGDAHWPVMRILMAHHLGTGLAVRPCWGPMHGDEAVSEQGLTEEILQRLPAGSAVMADRNFAVFSVAWAAQQAQRGVLMRITDARAKKIAGHILPPAGRERNIEWRPSRDDRRAHPELPKDAVVRGRLIVAHIPAENGEKQPLYLFTSLEEPAEEMVELYRRRWDIELDIRSLKQTLEMQSLSSRTPEMMEKELLMAISAYNLVRSVQMKAARLANMEPRRLSFSHVRNVIITALPRLATVKNAAQWNEEYQQVLRWAARGKLPKRTKPRSYTREVWATKATFPKRKSAKASVEKKADEAM